MSVLIKKQRCQKGFTLLELSVVMGLLLAVAAIAFPMAGTQYQRSQSKKFASELEYFLKQARMAAMEKGRNVALCHRTSPTQESLSMQIQDSTAVNACDGLRYKTLQLPYQENMRFDASDLNGYYDPRGRFNYAAGETESAICLNIQGRSFVRFSLGVFGVEQNQGQGICP